MPEKHLTDQEIHEASGSAPRDPPGVPKATCLRCLAEHTVYYATMAHDCRIDLAEKRSYSEWLLYFQTLGMGVLKTPADRKFPSFEREISGRAALTQHLQSDIDVGPGLDLRAWYTGPDWKAAGFSTNG